MTPAEQVSQQASDWFVAFCEREVDALGEQTFVRWLRESPQHAAAFLRVSAIWAGSGDLAKQARIDLDALLEKARSEEDAAPTHAGVGTQRPGFGGASWHRLALAACAVLVLAAIGILRFWTPGTSYATSAAEHRTVRLSDGSLMQLNARSRTEVHYVEESRTVDLVEGQALFSVAHDPRRPFVVRCGATRIRAVGTQFDVNKIAGVTIVTVAEGKISISANGSAAVVLVAAGEQAVVDMAGHPDIHHADVSAVTAWTEGKLVLDSTPLEEAVAQLNRTALRQLVVEDRSILKFHVSGVFPNSDPMPLARFLQRRFGVVAAETDGVVRLYGPPGSPSRGPDNGQ